MILESNPRFLGSMNPFWELKTTKQFSQFAVLKTVTI